MGQGGPVPLGVVVQPSAEVLVDRIATVLRQRLPPGVTPAYFEGFLRRNRPALVAVLDRQLAARATRYPAGTESPRSYGDRRVGARVARWPILL